jgi:site-specific DNA-methyltransferase (adenine-specific)
MRPYYEQDGITIYHGDCREILPDIRWYDMGLVLTDPPYGIRFHKGPSGRGAHNRRNTLPIAGDNKPFDPSILLDFDNVITWGANHYATRMGQTQWP